MKRTGIKRKTALAPGGPLTRKGSRPGRGAPIKPVNRKRAAANRKRNFGPEADAVERMPCLCASVVRNHALVHGLSMCWCDVVAAHVTARGMGAAKGCCMDIVPLCSAHHEEAGENRTSQRAAFEARYGLDLRREADRIAVGHEPPLGIRGLAQRWAEWSAYWTARQAHESVAGQQPAIPGVPMLDAESRAGVELGALMGWVRREMEREVERRCAGQGHDEPSFAWDREALAHRIMQALGAPFTEDTHGEHGLAWTLCEAAGWPS